VTTYYLTSSVLGGSIIEEMSGSGQKNVGYVYAGGQLLAKQSANQVTWKHPTPAGTSEYLTFNDNSNSGRNEFDPLGADLALQYTPPPEDPEAQGDIGAGHFGGIMDARWSDFFNISGGCTIDGVASSCGLAIGVVNSGGGEQCPNNECSRFNPNLRNGQGGIENFHAHGDGYSGYEPMGSTYLGHGLSSAPYSVHPNSDPHDEFSGMVTLGLSKSANGLGPQDTVTAKEYTLSHTAVSDLVKANNQSSASNGVILCEAYKESRAQGFSAGSGRNRRWYSPPLGTFNNAAQGSVSHRGLMQVGPVAAQLGGLGNGQGEGLTDARLQSVNPDYINNIWDPAANIRAGTGYIQYLMDHYNTDVEGALERFRGSPGSPTAQAYASNILDCGARVDAGDTLGGLGLIR
jgi:hypothetical protein